MIERKDDGLLTNRISDVAGDSALDAGLRAAFSGGVPGHPTAPAEHICVLDELEHRFGMRSHVMLRDDADEPSAVMVLRGEAASEGKYQVLGEIARGGVGVVLKGRDVDLGRDVAMKLLQTSHAENAAMVRRFIEEAQIAGQLQHPGILPVYEMGMKADGRPYFTMRLVKGSTLASILEDRKSSNADRARLVRIFESVCQTVAYAHSRGVIHRDLKPSNVMVGPFGEVQVVDWGLAKVMGQVGADEGATSTPRLDETVVHTVRSDTPASNSVAGSVMGTPAYMAPEQARGEVDLIDERADVFALGGILTEILTGRPPFHGTSKEMMADSAAGRIDPALARLRSSGAEEDLVQLAVHCIAPDRRQRPRNAKAVADAVAAHLTTVEERARAAELSAAAAQARAREERRARRLTLTLAGVVLLSVLAMGMGWGMVQRDRSEREAKAAQQANDVLNEATMRLGQALQSPVGATGPWEEVRSAADRIRAMLASMPDDQAIQQRGEEFLNRLAIADRDRRMVVLVEEAVILGATNLDRTSWEYMASQLRGAFLEHGIDVTAAPSEQVIEKVRQSESMIQLVEALELWIGTEGQLGYFGVQNFKPDHLNSWVEVLYAADKDPFRTNQRKVYYAVLNDYLKSGAPDPAKRDDYLRRLDALEATLDITTATPRSLSWLATTYYLLGNMNKGPDIFHQAVAIHPGDFMLNFDYAYSMETEKNWTETIVGLLRCVSIRPNVGGVWRKLGVALRETGVPDVSVEMLKESLRHQPDHAPTHVDLGVSLEAAKQLGDAEAAYRTAIDLDTATASAHVLLGRLLQSQGRLDEAIAELRIGHEGRKDIPGWTYPSADWIAECERQLAERSGEASPK